MIKGIISLFSSGLILNPMVLLGIIGGVFIYSRFPDEMFFSIFAGADFYLIGIAVAFIYTFAFNQVYKGYTSTVDWVGTFQRFIKHSFIILLTTFLSAVFFEFIVF